MKADKLVEDLQKKADNLERLAGCSFSWPDLRGKRLVMVGMGSSFFLAELACRRLRMAGINAFALRASSREMPLLDESDEVIAISATGGSVETVAFVERVSRSVIFLTNNPEPLVSARHRVVNLNSLPETGGVASLTYQATLVALFDLEQQLTGNVFLNQTLSRAYDATRWIVDNQLHWQPEIMGQVTGGDGAQFVAPLERLSSAEQSALMIRECPRLRADASEAGDWAHIDVYLTKNHDLRLVLFAGSPWQNQVLDWTTERNRRVVLIGGQSDRVDASIEFPHQDDEEVSLLAETTFTEIVAAQLWRDQ